MSQQAELIFLVEDDPGLNQAVERLLRAAGFEVRSFRSGEAVLTDPMIDEPGCLVIDVHLPGISGFELAARLKLNGVWAPVVVMTAHDDEIHRRAASDSGANAYLTKPFSASTLLNAVHAAVAGED